MASSFEDAARFQLVAVDDRNDHAVDGVPTGQDQRSWNEYRRFVLSELDRIARSIKEEGSSIRSMVENRIAEIKTEQIAVLRQEQSNSQLDRLKLWEQLKKQEQQISAWKGGIGVVAFLIGAVLSAAATYFVSHVLR